MAQHREVPVKVNAWVDERVADLVSVLSEFNGIMTLESCQGNRDSRAWISFRYGSLRHESWRELAEFVLGFLGPKLAHDIGDVAEVRICVSSFGMPQGEISIAPGAEAKVAKALKRLCPIWASQRFAYSCGKSRTLQSDC
jgi:hypothetical protein